MFKKKLQPTRQSVPSTIRTPLAAMLAGLVCITGPAVADIGRNETLFTDDSNKLPTSSDNRRKYAGPVVADFDQDGNEDLLAIEHGGEATIFWGDGNRFRTGPVLTNGDLHGAAVADHDGDGRIEILIARGGGGGATPRTPVMFEIGTNRRVTEQSNVTANFEPSRGRAATFVDGNNDGELDLILPSGRPDVRSAADRYHFVYSQNRRNQFNLSGFLPEPRRSLPRIAVMDFNNDDTLDLALYGGSELLMLQGSGNLSYSNVSNRVLPTRYREIAGVAPIDFDNDGDEDLFLSRSVSLRDAQLNYNENTSMLAFAGRPRNSEFVVQLSGDSPLMLSNYIAVGFEKRIFVGRNATSRRLRSPRAAGQQITISRADAEGFPANTNTPGLYIGHLGNNRWQIRATTFRNSSGVISNVSSLVRSTYPELRPNRAPGAILLENRNGRYVDVTRRSGINLRGSTAATVGDFDNNGFQDIFVHLFGSLSRPVQHMVLLNNGDGTFETTSQHEGRSFQNGIIGLSGEALDYNNDGRLDMVYADEYGTFRLLRNSLRTNSNRNHLRVRVETSPSGDASPLGAIVNVTGCGSSWNRRVGYSGEPSNQGLSTVTHFGLGGCNRINSVRVTYTNGETISTRRAPAVNSIITTDNNFR